jgi:transcriptional regulator with XRE-family HTH domain
VIHNQGNITIVHLNFGRREAALRALRIARTEAGMTAGELAARSGVGRNTISRIERGVVEPQAATLHKLAEALDVSVAYLLGEGWRQAYDNSLRFRAIAKERLGERLSLWEAARDEGASDELRRRLLDEVGLILDEAKNEVLDKLLENVNEGLDGMAKPSPEGTPNAYWEEVRKIDTLYRELVAMVHDAGLSVRSKTPNDTARARQHELEALAR